MENRGAPEKFSFGVLHVSTQKTPRFHPAGEGVKSAGKAAARRSSPGVQARARFHRKGAYPSSPGRKDRKMGISSIKRVAFSSRGGETPPTFPLRDPVRAWPPSLENQLEVEKFLHRISRQSLPFPPKLWHNGPGDAGRKPPRRAAGFSLLRVSLRPVIIDMAPKIEYKSQFKKLILQMG